MSGTLKGHIVNLCDTGGCFRRSGANQCELQSEQRDFDVTQRTFRLNQRPLQVDQSDLEVRQNGVRPSLAVSLRISGPDFCGHNGLGNGLRGTPLD